VLVLRVPTKTVVISSLGVAKSLFSEAVEGWLVAERLSAVWIFECWFVEVVFISKLRVAERLLGILLVSGLVLLLKATKAVFKFYRFRMVIHHRLVCRWHHRMMRQFSLCDDTLLVVLDDVGDVCYFVLLGFFDDLCLLPRSLMVGHSGGSPVDLVLGLLFGDVVVRLGGDDHPLLGDLLYNLGLMLCGLMLLDLGGSLVPLNNLLLVHLLRDDDVLLVGNVLLDMVLSLDDLLLMVVLVGLWRYLIVMSRM
jgi:hypothetical protein